MSIKFGIFLKIFVKINQIDYNIFIFSKIYNIKNEEENIIMKKEINTDKKKFIFALNFFPIAGIVVIAFVFIAVFFVVINNYFTNAQNIYKEHIAKSTTFLAQKELNSSYNFVNFLYVNKAEYLKKELIEDVEMGYSVIKTLHQENLSLDIIKKSLENMRFFDDKSGYFFVYDLKGDVLYMHIKKSLEGKNLYNYKDIKGTYIIRKIINYFKKYNQGFFEWYYIYPKTKRIEKKIGFAKVYRPLNIFIGSAIYETTIKKAVKKQIKNLFPIMTKDFSYKFIIYDSKGNVIFSNNKQFKNKNIYNINVDGKYIVQNVIKNAKKDKIFSFEGKNIWDNHIYQRFFRYYPKLNLYIGVKVDKTNLQQKILKQKNKMDEVVKEIISHFIIAGIAFIIIIFIVDVFIVKWLEQLFIKYENELIKQKEKAKASEKAKAEFLANMSHEIRTPLNAMFGFITILKEKEMDNESRKYLNIIEKSGKNLLTIINDILDFSKIESGKMTIEKIEFNPKEEIEIIRNLFSSSASQKNILLKFDENNLKWNIVSDPTRIKQVISNLLSNAIKFTPENKKIILNVKYDENKEELSVEIIDEGIGIPKDKLNTIFDSFSQADNSTTRKYGGSGLGLTISSKLIELLGGKLKVESEIGKGSKFYFTIPAKKTKLIPKKEKKEIKKTLDEKFDKYILVVEDNPANQMFMEVILDKMGVKFDMANDGIEAVEKFKQNKYDVILMDENMPNMDGIEATKRIREIERENHLNHIAIVALTANAMDGDKEKFILAGMDFYLSKPVDIEKLKNILRNIK